MQKLLVSGVVVASVLLAVGGASIGCAEGSGIDDTSAESTLTNEPGDASSGPSKTVLPPPSQNLDNSGVDSGGNNNGSDAGSNKNDAGGNPNNDAGPPPPPPPPSTTCTPAQNTCPTATDLGSVSGDTGSDTKSAQGSTSQWFTVRVTEDDNGLFGVPLDLRATLTSPPGVNFDLYVYVPSSDALECSAVTNSSTSTAATDSASVEFGETGGFSNGSADDRTVTVEVRYVSGSCAAGSNWTLTVQGDTY